MKSSTNGTPAELLQSPPPLCERILPIPTSISTASTAEQEVQEKGDWQRN